jgi:hypothetical protein
MKQQHSHLRAVPEDLLDMLYAAIQQCTILPVLDCRNCILTELPRRLAHLPRAASSGHSLVALVNSSRP